MTAQLLQETCTCGYLREIVTIDEAAAYLKVTRGTLGLLRYEGRGPTYYRLSPRQIRYAVADLDAFLEASREIGEAA